MAKVLGIVGILVGILFGATLLQMSYAIKPSFASLDYLQQSILNEFRANVERELPHHYMRSDEYLLKFLVRNGFSIPEATNHLHRHLEWRKIENVDNVLNEDWSDMEQMFPYDLWARTKSGNPILYIPVGRYNFREGIESGKSQRMWRYLGIKFMEDAHSVVRRLNAENSEIVQYEIIFDMERNQSRSLLDLACIDCLLGQKDLSVLYRNQYPLSSENIFIVNAPPLMEYTFPWLSDIMSELIVLGGRDAYEPVLLNYMERDQLPRKIEL